MTRKNSTASAALRQPLYLGCGDREGFDDGRAPVSIEDLYFGLNEIHTAMDGCHDMIEDLEKINRHDEFQAPLLMMRLTLEHAMGRLFTLIPSGTADHRDLCVHRDDQDHRSLCASEEDGEG